MMVSSSAVSGSTVQGSTVIPTPNCVEGIVELSDEALLARMADGEPQSLGALFDRYGGIAFGVAYRMLSDRTLAEDVVQESFLSAWRHASSFDAGRGSVRAWLLTTVRNRCVDLLRGPRRELKLEESVEAILSERVAADDVWDEVARVLDAADVRRALDQLPEEQRLTVNLAFFGGLTHAQIAAQMRVPLGTVKGRMRLALEKLREALVGMSDPETAR